MRGQTARSPEEQKVVPREGYAGAVTPEQAWPVLSEDPDAVLVGVRTQPEWVFVGVPDPGSLNKRAVFVPWRFFPSMQPNPEFANQLEAAGVKREGPVVFICRSPNRSKDAAIAMTAKGFRRCYNVTDGFEGPLDGRKRRGGTGGWKVAGLPWIQD